MLAGLSRSAAAMDVSITPAATDEEAAAIAAAIERPVAGAGGRRRRRRPAGAGVALQRPLVEPADPAAAGPALGLRAPPA